MKFFSGEEVEYDAEKPGRGWRCFLALVLGVGLAAAALSQSGQDVIIRPTVPLQLHGVVHSDDTPALPRNTVGVVNHRDGSQDYCPPEAACWTDQYGVRHPQTRELDGSDPATPKPQKSGFWLPPHIGHGAAVVLYDMYRNQP